MKLAIFSDIHANWEALSAAVKAAKEKEAGRFIVLGDTIGYGADPNDCFQWVLENAAVNLLGNHEKAIVDPSLRNWFSPIARTAIEWTETAFDRKLAGAIPGLPYIHTADGLSFAHSSLKAPETFPYLKTFEDAAGCFGKMTTAVCFIGHTHVPGCFCESEQSAHHLEPGILKLKEGERYILNPGSVGQPRDGDRRLSFGIFDDGAQTFEIVRIAYDNERAAGKIRSAGLPAFLADRLL